MKRFDWKSFHRVESDIRKLEIKYDTIMQNAIKKIPNYEHYTSVKKWIDSFESQDGWDQCRIPAEFPPEYYNFIIPSLKSKLEMWEETRDSPWCNEKWGAEFIIQNAKNSLETIERHERQIKD